jgi:hypothetical protein
VPNNPQGRETDLLTQEELDSLLERAKKGDSTVLPLLGRVLDECPALWQSYGDLAMHAQRALVTLAGGGGENLYLCESLLRKLSAMKAELMGDSPSPLEKLLADEVAACWLQVNYYDALVAQSRQCPPAQMKLLQKRGMPGCGKQEVMLDLGTRKHRAGTASGRDGGTGRIGRCRRGGAADPSPYRNGSSDRR